METYPSIPFSYSFGVPLKKWETVRTEFDSGHSQTRSKSTVAPRRWPANAHVGCSAANVSAFQTFYDLVKCGSEKFTFVDPSDGQSRTARMVEEPQIFMTDYGIYDITNLVFEEAL